VTDSTLHQPARKVLVVCDGRGGPTATQKISFAQPFEGPAGMALARIVFEKDQPDPVDIATSFADHSPDLLVLSRYTSQQGTRWIELARSAGIPVIFHIDDDLLAVPSSLGVAKHSAYNSPERLDALRTNIESSDLLYASTAELAARFTNHGIGTPIVAGDIYCSVSPADIGPLIAPATGPVIGYMGTGGHSADLEMIMPAICEVMDAVPELQFEVFGTIEMPPELGRFGRRARHLPPVADYSSFIPHLRSLGWWVGLAPLEDNAFNRCKADTKWVEYSLAGMAVVASDLPAYKRACAGGAGMLARSNADWNDAVLTLLYRAEVRDRMTAAAQQKLRERYTHDSLRRQVQGIFDQVFPASSSKAVKGPRQQSSRDAPLRPAH
jgi:hypothetical protein